MRASVRIALIGCGAWGTQHLRVLKNVPESTISALVDIDPARRLCALEQNPSARCFPSLEDALADVDIDAVVIATPAATHAGLIECALHAGKHVLCEKPLCLSAGDAIRLTNLARELRLLLLVGHTFLLEPGLIEMKRSLEARALGSLRYITAIRHNIDPIRCDVGVIRDLLTHDVAILNWLLDTPPKRVRATGASFVQPDIEDVAFATLYYDGNRPLAQISVSWLEPVKERRITCVGSLATALWNPRADQPLNLFEEVTERDTAGRSIRRAVRPSRRDSFSDTTLEPLREEDAEFIQLIRAGGQSRLADHEFNVGVVQTVEAIRRSFENSGELVHVSARRD